jgi:hypothetical protein
MLKRFANNTAMGAIEKHLEKLLRTRNCGSSPEIKALRFTPSELG